MTLLSCQLGVRIKWHVLLCALGVAGVSVSYRVWCVQPPPARSVWHGGGLTMMPSIQSPSGLYLATAVTHTHTHTSLPLVIAPRTCDITCNIITYLLLSPTLVELPSRTQPALYLGGRVACWLIVVLLFTRLVLLSFLFPSSQKYNYRKQLLSKQHASSFPITVCVCTK